MSSRQSKRKRPSTDCQDDTESYSSRKSAKKAKKTIDSVSNIGSVSYDSSDDNSDWLTYDHSINRPSRVRKKSAKLLEAEEEVDLEIAEYPDISKASNKRDKNGKRGIGREEDYPAYNPGPLPELKISIGKDKDEKGNNRKSKDKKKKPSEGMSGVSQMYLPVETMPESKHKSSSKKSKKNIPAPLEGYPESPVKDKDSGIKLKLILSPKEKEKSEPFYSISSPEAEFSPACVLEKEKKKKKRKEKELVKTKEKESVKTKLTFHSDGNQQSNLFQMESAEAKKNKRKKKKYSDVEENLEFAADVTVDAGDKPAKKKKKKVHAEHTEVMEREKIVPGEIAMFEETVPPLVSEEKTHKEKKKKQKKDKKEKDKRDKKDKSKERSKDKMKIKLKVPEDEETVVVESDALMQVIDVRDDSGSPAFQFSDSMEESKTSREEIDKQKKLSKPKEKKEKKDTKTKGSKKDKGRKDKKEKSKKPLSAYMLWCNHNRSKLVADNPGIDFSTISKKLGAIWQQLSDKEKGKWKRKQRLQKSKHKNVPNLSKNKHELKDKAIKPKAGSPVRKSSSPLRCSEPNTQPIDMAAYLKLLGESLSLVGNRLQEHQGNIEVHGSLSVLLDSTLCALGPLLCLTSQVKELDGCPHNTQVSLLDNIAYIMPGL
ncbi:HMG domain-containing protein 4-like [Ptychodera flava]|uniref:HMG domain-containing protein 4-like n=1 Tax=Ptychodera flava TaxID=63121 RepID=UPI00396A37CC